MLRVLTATMRRRSGLVFALVYLACILFPPMAMAFANGADCITDDHNVAAIVHVHANGSAHHHESQEADQKPADADGKTVPGHCCGMFCLSATTDEMSMSVGVTPRGCTLQQPLEAALGGLAPDRIDRPPDVLLSF